MYLQKPIIMTTQKIVNVINYQNYMLYVTKFNTIKFKLYFKTSIIGTNTAYLFL